LDATRFPPVGDRSLDERTHWTPILSGVVFHNEWLALDPRANALGLSFSNGGTSTIGT